MMGFGDAVRNALMNNYVGFKGRASRSEYWWFVLFTIIVNFIATAFPSDITPNPTSIIVSLAIFFPSLGVIVRRLHDLGKSGWWILLAIIPIVNFIGIFVILVFMVMEGEEHTNQYGEVPTNTLE